MLLNPFEKQLDLPAFPVKLRDRKGIQLSVIGDEPVNLVSSKVFIGHHSDWFRSDYIKLHIVLGNSNEESFLPINPIKQTKEVHVCFVGPIVRIPVISCQF